MTPTSFGQTNVIFISVVILDAACSVEALTRDGMGYRDEMGSQKAILGKGSSINYVITFGGLGRPPPPHVIL